MATESVVEHDKFLKLQKAKHREDKKRMDRATLELEISKSKAAQYKRKAEKSKQELLRNMSRQRTNAYHQG